MSEAPTTARARDQEADNRRRGSLVLDEELEGMAAIAKILGPLSHDQQRRMLGYLCERFIPCFPEPNPGPFGFEEGDDERPPVPRSSLERAIVPRAIEEQPF